MPPVTRDDHDKRNLGWKLFFGLLMFIQLVGVGVLWRTYDAITATRALTAQVTLKVDEVVIPKLTDHEQRIRWIEGRRTGP